MTSSMFRVVTVRRGEVEGGEDGTQHGGGDRVDRYEKVAEQTEHGVLTKDDNNVLSLEEIRNLAADGGQPAETLMNVVALIAKRFRTDVCSAYLLEPDRANLVLAATVGLRKECIGNLRMEVHEGLTGLVAELV